MKKIKIIFYILIVGLTNSYGHSNTDMQFCIEGNVQSFNTRDKLELIFYDDYFDEHGEKEVYNISIKDKKFKTNIIFATKFRYMKISYGDGSNYNRFLASYAAVFLVAAGDRIRCNLSFDDVFFSGLGSSKLTCQKTLFEEINSRTIVSFDKVNQGDFDGYYLYALKALDSIQKDQQVILSKYKNILEHNTYRILQANSTGLSEIRLLRELRMSYRAAGNVKDKLPIVKEIYRTRYGHKYVDTSDSPLLVRSAYYAEFLFEKERLAFEMMKSDTPRVDRNFLFGDLYHTIKAKYTGVLRDKIITCAFYQLLQKSSLDASEYLNDAVKAVKNKKYKEIIINFQNAYVKGRPAFNFSLPDTSGKIYKLKDFTGKLVIIDFWFTGCTACMLLARDMVRVKEYFKTNNDVVFMTISIDKNKTQWRNSVASGKYTSSKSINLYTNGLGSAHPLIKYYNYSGFPQILIIDKDGKILSSNPPRPLTSLTWDKLKSDKDGTFIPADPTEPLSNNTKQFLKLIDEYIHNGI